MTRTDYDSLREAAWQEAMRLMNGKPIHSFEQAMIRLKWKIVPVLHVPRDEAHGIAHDLLNDVAASHRAQFHGAYDIEDMDYSHGNATTSDILLDLAEYAKTHEVSENENLDLLIEMMLVSMDRDLLDRIIAFVTAYPDVAEVEPA